MESRKIISWMYLFGLGLMIASIPLSKFMMSVSQFILSGTIILDFLDREKALRLFRRNSWKTELMLIPTGIYLILESVVRIFINFFRRENMPAVIFSSIFLVHVLGLLYTTDLAYAMKDIRIKLPVFILPIIISLSPSLDYKKFRLLLLLFAFAVVAGTLISTQILLTQNITDPRNIAIFISHIRFSLLIVFAVFVLLYFAIKEKDFSRLSRLGLAILAVWLTYYLFLSASMTGLVILALTLLIYAIVRLFISASLLLKILVPSGILAVVVLLTVFVLGVAKDVYRVYPVDFSKLDKETALGNLYWNDTTLKEVENGHYVWIYIATIEMRDAWNQRSRMDFDGKDEKGQTLKFTLMRFLTSKGYRKDAEGVSKLTDEEVRLIEQGVASTVYRERSNIYVRVYKMIWGLQQYQSSKDPSGMSFLQRLEFWRASLGIIRDHWITGVGTGDLNEAFEKQYREMDSPLSESLRWRSHNQYMAIFIAFGIFGLAWFLFTIIYPPVKLGMLSDYFYLIFFVIITLSMLTEDTIETQAGATIYAFFTSLLLFGRKWKLKA
jgi:O-antigen ligase